MREIRTRWEPHRTSAARYPLDERGCEVHFVFLVFISLLQLFDGHLLGKDSLGLSRGRLRFCARGTMFGAQSAGCK